MHLRRLLLVLPALSALSLGACAAKRLPGSDIEDTKDTRAILEVLRQYQNALMKQDAQAILALVSPTFHDDLGTRNPADDVDHAKLQRELPGKLAALTDVNVDLSLREITFDGPRAFAVFYFDTSYRIPKIQNPQRADSDLARMEFAREDGKWMIIRGL